MKHVSVSPTDGNGPTQGQRKTLTRVGIEPTTFGLDLRRSIAAFVFRIWTRNFPRKKAGSSSEFHIGIHGEVDCQMSYHVLLPMVLRARAFGARSSAIRELKHARS